MKIFSAEYICTQISWDLPSGARTSFETEEIIGSDCEMCSPKKDSATKFSGLFYLSFHAFPEAGG